MDALIVQKRVELFEAKEVYESQVNNNNAFKSMQERRIKLERRLVKIEETVGFIRNLPEEPKLILNEMESIKAMITNIETLDRLTGKANLGQVDFSQINRLQDIVNGYDKDLTSLKKSYENLKKSYNTLNDFQKSYFASNRLTVEDYHEIYLSIVNGTEYRALLKYKNDSVIDGSNVSKVEDELEFLLEKRFNMIIEQHEFYAKYKDKHEKLEKAERSRKRFEYSELKVF